jgi:hypothetical protein
MEKTKESQNKLILAYLQYGKSLTALEALEIFGCFRLASRISDIKSQGIEIKSEYITLWNGKRVKRYWI